MRDDVPTTIPGWPKCSSCGLNSVRDGGQCSPCRTREAVQGHLYVASEVKVPGTMLTWLACAECDQPRWAHDLYDGTRELAGQLEEAALGVRRTTNGDALSGDHTYLARAARTTSAAAAERARLTVGGSRRRVLEAIVAAGDAGATDEELQQQLGLPANTERPRRLELCEAGYLMDSGDERPTASGARAIVWLPTLAGLAALERQEAPA